MNYVDELKKYKELLDNEIITQEEFDEKKMELLAGNTSDSPAQDAVSISDRIKRLPKWSKKILNKKVMIALGIIAVLVLAICGLMKIVGIYQQSTRETLLEEEIQPIMNTYGIYGYEVKRNGAFEVYASGFRFLTNGEALECLEELDGVSIDDPFSDDELDFGVMARVHPGSDVEYSYWRVSTALVLLNQKFGGNYDTPGIYCNQYGSDCVFACDN